MTETSLGYQVDKYTVAQSFFVKEQKGIFLTAIDLLSRGIKVNAVIDTRKNPKLFDEKHMEFKANNYTFKHFK